MKMKKLFILAAAAAMLAGCSETDELAKNQLSKAADDGAISFSVYTNRAVTRAGKAGVLNTDSLKKPDGGFGVFAYHTNNSLYDSQNSEMNFMYNQKVTWNGQKWEYDPVKYWPNEFGDNAKSNDIDYVSFFAYAPYVDFNPMTGVAPAGEDAQQQQWKNITSASRNGDLGDPLIRYMVDTNPQTSVDLLWGVAANEKFKGLAPTATTTPLKEGGCYLNLSKQVGVDDKIEWRFHHALSKLKVEIIAATDVATEGTDEYVPADGATAIAAATRVYLRWIEFQGFAMSGALNLYSATPLDGTVPTAKWMSYDGATDLKITTVRFNDGLFDGEEGIADNVNPNERVLGELNDTIIEKSTPAAGWTAKNAGIPTAHYTNLFANAKEGKDCIYVIPTSSPVKISMLYDIETADRRVVKYLSDGKTTGVRIANEISKSLDDLKFEAGKAYNIKIVVGLESVKVTAEVADWDNEAQTVDVDMPYNPGGDNALTMQALTAGTIVVNNPKNGMQYSLNGGAKTPVTSDAINVSAGDKVRFYGNVTSYDETTIAGGTAQVKVYGNIMSLIEENNYGTLTPLPDQYNVFRGLFSGNTKLTDASELLLPATTLAIRCYDRMFEGCTSLTAAPILPATTLAKGCYQYMFSGCTSLETAPVLPAPTLDIVCYEGMFSNTGLTTVPELPATTLAYDCYSYMFYGCTSLTNVPSNLLPVTTLAESCYSGMFKGCTSLTAAPALPATTLAEWCYSYMFQNCTSLETAPTLPAPTLVGYCYNQMFKGCTSLNNITCLATAGINQSQSTSEWVNGVASTGTFTKASGATIGAGGWWSDHVNGIPNGWTVNEQ